MVDDMIVVSRWGLPNMPALDFGRLCEWVAEEAERREEAAKGAPWPDGDGKRNPNAGVKARVINGRG